MNTKRFALSLAVVLAVTLPVSPAMAGDFDWLKELSIQAKADPDGFVARVAARFEIGKAQVQAVIGNVDSPADAYMALRMGEMAEKPVDDVLKVYKAEKDKGWGAMAKSLGIKPGSDEFHALKAGHDIDSGKAKGKGGKEKEKGEGKGKGKDKD